MGCHTLLMTKTCTHRLALACATTVLIGGVVGTSVLNNTYSHASTTHAITHAASATSTSVSEQRRCELDGSRMCGHVLACWLEHHDPDPERVCGYADEAVPGSTNFAYGDWLSRTFSQYPQSV